MLSILLTIQREPMNDDYVDPEPMIAFFNFDEDMEKDSILFSEVMTMSNILPAAWLTLFSFLFSCLAGFTAGKSVQSFL